MTDRLKEQISALVDDELPAGEQELLLARLARDPQLRDSWQRYHLISDTLRNHLPDRPDEGLAGRVMAAVDGEPALAVRRAVVPGWLRPLAGVAVAASVAVVAVFAVQSLSTGPDGGPAAPVSVASQGSDYLRAQPTDWDPGTPRVPSRLAGYLVNHNEYAANSGVQGMLPYVRIVGYENAP